MKVTATASASCSAVEAEISARAQGKGSWVDPHNGGIYSLTSSEDGIIKTERSTNPSTSVPEGTTYTDKQIFVLTDAGSSCKIEACSESQSTSVGDFSTNYCDIINLYGGSAAGYNVVSKDFTSDESSHKGSVGAGHDASKCIVSSLKSTATGPLVTFDGAEETSFNFKILNDPVMGGKSTGSWSLGSGFGILDGEVVNVPSLSAPGFIKAAGDGTFPDISAFADGNLVLSVRTTTPDYAGYRVTVVSGAVSADFACAGGGGLPFSRGCYKEKFSVPAGSEFVDVKIPFNTFSDKWSSATGEHTAECADDSSTCLTAAKLAKVRRVEFWGEGANGKLHLEVQSVSAESASGERAVLV